MKHWERAARRRDKEIFGAPLADLLLLELIDPERAHKIILDAAAKDPNFQRKAKKVKVRRKELKP